ncbi:MAG: cytochrome ubiquinol oxidase subunit I [Muribaculaceae bacterium]|nr:cytochrome ubiquinol oxidase subunit I [Muribaculaceae bacterium]
MMDELVNVVDWSRLQFALTAIVHWLFVPLTIGLSLIVGIMETVYYRTRNEKWRRITKFWMTLFGINFACGVATGLILEFEFGTNWSNYSWFVGDIFGAPLAIEGIVAFFLESTFIAVMFFGWKRVSPRFHLAATWLTAVGVMLSALWILVANAWMQYPAGMEFDPDQMRNVMVSFSDVVFSPVAINKFFHTVLSGWVLGAVFVVGVSCWLLVRKRNREFALKSIKVAGGVGLAGIILTIWTGDGSAVQVAKYQPMKLAAMEGLYSGQEGQSLVAFGIVNTDKRPLDDKKALYAEISIPKGLSLLARHDLDAFVPGIDDLIRGYAVNEAGDTVYKDVSYARRIEMGRDAQTALYDYGVARDAGDSTAMDSSLRIVKENFRYFGYGYLSAPEDAVPPVALSFYSFRVMVMAGGYLLLFFLVVAWASWRRKVNLLDNKWFCALGLLTIPVVWICSEAGWILAEVGRQPWTIEGLLPVNAAISSISAGSVQTTFWIFVVIFTALLAAEISIMVRHIRRKAESDLFYGPEK